MTSTNSKINFSYVALGDDPTADDLRELGQAAKFGVAEAYGDDT